MIRAPLKTQWNRTALFFAVFLLALTVRLLKLITDPMLLRDSALYLALAEKWQKTGSYAQTIIGGTIIPPLPLFSIVKATEYGLDSEIAGRSIALFLGAIIPVLGYIISYKLSHRIELSLISALILILHPTLISYSIQPLRENYYLFFLGLVFITLINGIKTKKMKDWGLSGILIAFAAFCRYEALEFILLIPAIAYFVFRTSRNKYNTIKPVMFFFLAFILTSVSLLSMVGFDMNFVKKILVYFR